MSDYTIFALVVTFGVLVFIVVAKLVDKKEKPQAVLHVMKNEESEYPSLEMVAISPLEELIKQRYFLVEVKIHDS